MVDMTEPGHSLHEVLKMQLGYTGLLAV